ncbi:MAG TPA: hypothetical protein VJT83_01005, partial [Chitinophagaceae bacterium]|nr:hypothetical protein [Chitinophagaceae bacterium]
ELYFTTGIGTDVSRTTHLFKLTGPALSEIALPAGHHVAPVPHTTAETYNGALFIGTVFSDGSAHVLKYDGITFAPFFDITAPSVVSGIRLFKREGNLMIHPNFVNGTSAFEYDGASFEEIKAPAGRLLFPYINSTACNHLWLNYYSDASGIHWAYAKESKPCATPPPAGAPVIPDHFMDYERFEMGTYGPERGWCWSEIIIDWQIVPICELPPCPIPEYEARMMDANNGVQWFEQFNKPSRFKIPLPDEQPFRTVLTLIDTKEDLLVFEPDLVPAGIEGIKINMRPKLGGFELTTLTRNGKQVPLQVTLVNENGKVLWQEIFTAPFSEKITATVQEAGKKLVFSIPKLITRAK